MENDINTMDFLKSVIQFRNEARGQGSIFQ